MIKSRINYWSCSKFADFIRGEKKPYALELGKWDDWKKNLKKRKPIRYWFCEKFLNKAQDFFMLPIDLYRSVKVYIRNRFIDKIHYLKTNLKPGEYYDLDHRIIHGLFSELTDYVEVELAHLSKWDKNKKYKFKKGRCPEAGLDYLNWACGLTCGEDFGLSKNDKDYLKPTPQAKSSQKILELYNWWKNRDNRADPYEIYTKEKDGKFYYKKIHKLERNYEKEDTKMLIDLIKIRGSLWT